MWINRFSRRSGLSVVFIVFAACFAMGARTAPLPEPAGRGKVLEITVHGTSLEGNLDNDPADRPVSVYLPPNYEREPKRRYPVIYFLHSFGDTNAKWFGADQNWVNLREVLDRAIASGAMKEVIAVVPNAYTRFRGSFYSNSIVTGNWEDFIVSDLTRYIDSHYRTVPHRDSRGIAGHAMGGYGAIRIAMHHPEVFSSVYALSACCLAWGADFQPGGAPAMKLRSIHTEAALQGADEGVYVQFAMAAAWSPNPGNPPFYVDFPAQGGELPRPEIVAKWSANLPLANFDQYLTNIRRLKAIAFDVGDQDDYAHVPLNARMLDQTLTTYKIPHTYEVYQGTHTSNIPDRVENKLLPFFAKNLNFPPAEKSTLPTK